MHQTSPTHPRELVSQGKTQSVQSLPGLWSKTAGGTLRAVIGMKNYAHRRAESAQRGAPLRAAVLSCRPKQGSAVRCSGPRWAARPADPVSRSCPRISCWGGRQRIAATCLVIRHKLPHRISEAFLRVPRLDPLRKHSLPGSCTEQAGIMSLGYKTKGAPPAWREMKNDRYLPANKVSVLLAWLKGQLCGVMVISDPTKTLSAETRRELESLLHYLDHCQDWPPTGLDITSFPR